MTEPQTRTSRLDNPYAPYIALILAMIIWGSSFIALKISFRYFHPFFVIFARMFLASLCFLPFMKQYWKVVRREDWMWIGLMALSEPCLYYIFEATGLALTTASQAGMITSMLPLLVAIPSALFLKERISRRTIIGFLIAIAGAVWLSLAGDATEEAPNPQLGNFLEFLAMICAAGYTVILKKLSSRYSPFFLTAMQAMIGTVFFLPIILILPGALVMTLTTTSVLMVVFLGIVVSIGAYGFYNFGTSRIPASQSSSFVNLIPVITLILSILILKESMNTLQYVASAMVILGVIYSQDRTVDEIPAY